MKENMESICKQLLTSKTKLEAKRSRLTEKENHMVGCNTYSETTACFLSSEEICVTFKCMVF